MTSTRKRRPHHGVEELEAATVQDNTSTGLSLSECIDVSATALYRILSPHYIEDTQFAVLFAEGANRELAHLRAAAQEAASGVEVHQTSYGFFGRTDLLINALKRDDTSKLSITLGVPGSAKSKILVDYILEAYDGAFRRSHGKDPSVLVSAATNEQCRKLFDLLSTVSQSEGSLLPPPFWYARNCHRMNDILKTSTTICGDVVSKDQCTESVQNKGALRHTHTEESRNVVTGSLHPLDLPWRTDERVIQALVDFSRTLHEIYIFDSEQRDLEKLFAQLSSLSDVQGLLLKATGLAVNRQQAHEHSGTLLNVLKMKEAELVLRHKHLMKIAAEVITDFKDIPTRSQPVRIDTHLNGTAANVARPLVKVQTGGQLSSADALKKRETRSTSCVDGMVEIQGIHICTHEFATQYITEKYFDVVILSDVGVLDLYRGSCLCGLALHMVKLLGDPLQGARPCTSLADSHLNHCLDFKIDSLRCPQSIMTLVQVAYRARLRDPSLTLTGAPENGASKWPEGATTPI